MNKIPESIETELKEVVDEINEHSSKVFAIRKRLKEIESKLNQEDTDASAWKLGYAIHRLTYACDRMENAIVDIEELIKGE